MLRLNPKNRLFIFGISLFMSVWLTANAATQTSTISSNPAAINITPGTGALQRYLEKKLGIQNNHGVYIDGAWIANVNNLFSGGIPHAERWTTNNLLVLGMTVDTDKLIQWRGGLFGVQLLQFNGQATNEQAGTVQGYNSLPGPRPLNRFEVYQLWYRQEFLNKKIVVRVGKVVPTFDFNNVIKPVPLQNSHVSIPAVTGLIYTPIFINPTLFGTMPGYYNSAYGVTINLLPIKEWYLSLGSYDGNLAQGKQTGLTGPNFNGYYFHVAETGLTWLIGKNNLPGSFGLGAWHQTGVLQNSSNLTEHGASGYYLFGSQRMWYKHPGADNSGISIFYQYGSNNSSTLPITQYVGGGLTAFGLIPCRIDDSFGIGSAYSWLNQNDFVRNTELMLQAYYQAKVMNGIYLQPVLSYIPTPGATAHLSAAWAGTISAIILF